MNPNTRFLIFLIVMGFIGLSSLITILYFDKRQNKRVRGILKEERKRRIYRLSLFDL
ncbi:unnamed protein product [marine sediment metagenome]|uniref:Uncharacterized protein n=1 Tax=marine sediment metagenome TaxID=412755 RepID=X1JYC7_9ZZZZ